MKAAMLDELVDGAMALAQAMMKHDGELAPVFLTGNSVTRQKRVIPLRNSTPQEKAVSILTLRAFVKALDADFAVVISEVWFKNTERGEGLPNGRRVSDYEDKREGIMALGRAKSGYFVMRRVETIRGADTIEFKVIDTAGDEIVQDIFTDKLWEE